MTDGDDPQATLDELKARLDEALKQNENYKNTIEKMSIPDDDGDDSPEQTNDEDDDGNIGGDDDPILKDIKDPNVVEYIKGLRTRVDATDQYIEYLKKREERKEQERVDEIVTKIVSIDSELAESIKGIAQSKDPGRIRTLNLILSMAEKQSKTVNKQLAQQTPFDVDRITTTGRTVSDLRKSGYEYQKRVRAEASPQDAGLDAIRAKYRAKLSKQ